VLAISAVVVATAMRQATGALQLLRRTNVNRIDAGTAAAVAAIQLHAANHGKVPQCGKVSSRPAAMQRRQNKPSQLLQSPRQQQITAVRQ